MDLLRSNVPPDINEQKSGKIHKIAVFRHWKKKSDPVF